MIHTRIYVLHASTDMGCKTAPTNKKTGCQVSWCFSCHPCGKILPTQLYNWYRRVCDAEKFLHSFVLSPHSPSPPPLPHLIINVRMSNCILAKTIGCQTFPSPPPFRANPSPTGAGACKIPTNGAAARAKAGQLPCSRADGQSEGRARWVTQKTSVVQQF